MGNVLPLTERGLFLVECLDLPCAAEVDDAVWEQFQIAHFNDDSVLRIENKSRQIAWSFTVAAESVARAVLDAESSIFVSINLLEAKEKIRYARRVYHNLQIAGLPKLVRNNELGLEFDNGARINSLPSKAPRGRSKSHVILDEFAHVQHDAAIYKGSLPVLSKGGTFRIGSSPMGATGVFWEIVTEEVHPFPGYARATTPWWDTFSFTEHTPDKGVESLPTSERVERYGNERIKLIYYNMFLDDFQQEYECTFVDEIAAFITWQNVKDNQDTDLLYWHVKYPSELDVALREMRESYSASEIERSFVCGVDVGRKKNLTEIVLLGLNPDTAPVRLMVSLDRVKFDLQENCIREICRVLPIARLAIDSNGLGMQLSENLTNLRGTDVTEATFTNATKAEWASAIKIRMERKKLPIPTDRDLAYQIHSIKRNVTAAKNVVYDTSANEKHHADKFWALALASYLADEHASRPYYGEGIKWQRR